MSKCLCNSPVVISPKIVPEPSYSVQADPPTVTSILSEEVMVNGVEHCHEIEGINSSYFAG